MGNRLAYSSPNVKVSSPALPELPGQPTLVFSCLSGTDHRNTLFEHELELRTADERSPIFGTAANLGKKPLRGPAGAVYHTIRRQPLACCASSPAKWRPGLKVNVRWLVDKTLDGVTYGSWYQAETELPPYGRATYGLWAIFLPGDRVKVMVRGSVEAGYTNVWTRPSDDDPYVVVGTLDEAANREAEARREVQRQRKEAYAVEVANREKKLLRQQENER